MDPKYVGELMRRCIKLSQIYVLGVSGPYVGSIYLDENQKIIGEGHKKIIDGTGLVLHAERDAFNNIKIGNIPKTLVTTLEPCVNFNLKKRKREIFDPCSELIVNEGIKQVYIQRVDRNPRVRTQGIEYLRRNGVYVEVLGWPSFEVKDVINNVNNEPSTHA